MNELAVSESTQTVVQNTKMSVLNASLVQRVDDALAQVGAFGEVRLIVVKGRLRFIQIMQSESIIE